MKEIILLLTICCVFFNASSQDIPNPGFENWKNSGNYEDPQDWGTINQATSALSVKTVVKATGTEAHSGSFAIKLISKRITVLGKDVPGIATTGTINTTTQEIQGGFAYALRPAFLTGWYRYAPAGVDTASVEINLYKWDATATKRILIGSGRFKETASVSAYAAFKAPLTYFSSLDPDTAVITLLSSQNNSAVVNSTFIVDDLSFELSTSSTQLLPPAFMFRIYPNPVAGELIITSLVSSSATLIIYTQAGSKLSETFLGRGNTKLSVQGYDNGMYFYQIVNTEHQMLGNGKFIIHK